MPNAKYIIEPTPFKMRATSPVNQNGDENNKLPYDSLNLVSIKPPSYITNTNAVGTLDVVNTSIPNNAAEIVNNKKNSGDDNKTSVDDDNTSGSDGKKFYENLPKPKTPSSVRTEERSNRVQNRQINKTIKHENRLKSRVKVERFEEIKKRKSPLPYSVANPFSPNQQDLIGQVYNPNGNDINQFQDGQAFNKFASNPNTLNEPPIPTEAQTTMNDLQMENEPMGAFGDDLTGAMNNNVGLPPEQGMGSTRGFVPQLSRKERRQQRRSDRREQGTGLRNFMTRAVTGGMLGYNGPGNEDRQYRRTGTRPFGS